jgi:tRNA G18 (ribose-2'-O)-methylase SpoU
MTLERLSRATDPRITDYRSVADPELLRSRGLFVAEGRLVVRRVIEDGHYRIRSLLVNDAARRDLDVVVEQLDDVPIYVCETSEFLQITGFNIHRGCLALVERPPLTPLDDVVSRASTIVVIDGVANADNVGGVFRNAAAFGADGVVLSPTTCDPFYRKAIRTSMGAVLRVPFARADEWPAAVSRVRAAGFTIVALTPREPSEPLDRFAARPRPSKMALVVGSEGAGLSPSIEERADFRVRIPISDAVDSLNLGVAVGIALYAVSANVRTSREPSPSTQPPKAHTN